MKVIGVSVVNSKFVTLVDVKETESDIIGDPLVVVLVFGRIIVVLFLVSPLPLVVGLKTELAVTVTFFP